MFSALLALCLTIGVAGKTPSVGWGSEINIYTLSPDNPSLYVLAKPSGAPIKPQLVILDTGSSTLMFCTESAGLPQYREEDSLTCNVYGSTVAAGLGYQGAVDIGGGSPNYLSVPAADYVAGLIGVDGQLPQFCGGVNQGIFGVAFGALNSIFNTSFTPAEALNSSTPCAPVPGMTDIEAVPPPLLQELHSQDKDTQDRVFLGIHWDGTFHNCYEPGCEAGTLFLGDAVHDNRFLPAQTEQSHVVRLVGTIGTLNATYYTAALKSITYSINGSQPVAAILPGRCPQLGPKGLVQENCVVMDTGTSGLLVPPEIYFAAAANGMTGTISYVLKTASGPDLRVDFNVAKLNQPNGTWFMQPAYLNLIGLPLWEQFYTAFNVSMRGDEGSVEMVRVTPGPGPPHASVKPDPSPEPVGAGWIAFAVIAGLIGVATVVAVVVLKMMRKGGASSMGSQETEKLATAKYGATDA